MNDIAITELRNIVVVGPALPGSAQKDGFAWTATLQLADTEASAADRSLVNTTMALRVVLQAPEKDRGPKVGKISWVPPKTYDLRLRTPHLLSAIAVPSKGEAILAVEGGGVDSTYALLPAVAGQDRGSREIVLVPMTQWPMPQRTSPLQKPGEEIRVTPFRLTEGRVKVLLNACAKGFLRGIPDASPDLVHVFVSAAAKPGNVKNYPRLEVPTVKVTGAGPGDRFVAVELTADGIEIEGTLADPQGTGRASVIVRLVHTIDPLDVSKSRWSLELLRDSVDARWQAYLQALRKSFSEAGERVFDLEIDSTRPTPAILWPLDLVGGGLAFPTTVDAQKVEWVFELAGESGRARLLGSHVEGGEIPTVVMISPDRVRVSKRSSFTLVEMDADRRKPGSTSDPTVKGASIPGPNVDIAWQPGTPPTTSVAITGDASGSLVPWYLDESELARQAVARYSAAGVHPAGAKTTYAFMPVERGWLQWPLPVPRPETAATSKSSEAAPIPLDGSLEYAIAVNASTASPQGRRVTVLAADYVAAKAYLASGSLTKQTVTLAGAAGQASGALWFATASPSSNEILPHLRAGPVSLGSPWLRFDRAQLGSHRLRPMWSARLEPGKPYALSYRPHGADAPATLWRRADELPLVSAIAMTRTAESSPDPLVTRNLLPRRIDPASVDSIDLVFGEDAGIPTLAFVKGAKRLDPDNLSLVSDTWTEVPLVPVTLAGIEFKTGAGALRSLPVRLRHDLPQLDELFAKTRLPRKAPVRTTGEITAEPPPADSPTTLDPAALERSWKRSRDQLLLSYTQSFTALSWGPWSRDGAEVTGLMEPAVWAADFEASARTSIQVEDKTALFAFGQFVLDDTFAGSSALAGLTARFKLDGLRLVRDDSLEKRPVRVTGFATGLWNASGEGGPVAWRDTRGAATDAQPEGRGVEGGYRFTLRRVSVTSRQGAAAVDDVRWRATALEPIPILPPASPSKRSLGLWFRDLPLAKVTDQVLEFTADAESPEHAIGPSQSAFDAPHLPFGVYEWRFCNDPGSEDAPSLTAHADYEVALGPFRFRPARLLHVRLSGSGSNRYEPESATVVGTLAPPGEKADSADPGPFGPDLAYATGAVIAVELRKGSTSSGFVFQGFKAATFGTTTSNVPVAPISMLEHGSIQFRLSNIRVKLADADGKQPTTGVLSLTLDGRADDAGRPLFSSATMDVVLFGSVVHFSNGTVTYGSSNVQVHFNTGIAADPGTCVAIDSATLRWRDDLEAGHELQLRGHIQVAIVDALADGSAPANATLNQLGFAKANPQLVLAWDNLSTTSVAATVDHSRGLIAVTTHPPKATRHEPVAGIVLPEALAEARLVIAIRRDWEASAKQDVFRGVSGFGSLLVVAPEGEVRRFQHTVRSPATWTSGNPAVWLSDVELDSTLRRESRIHWPIGVVEEDLVTATGEREAITALASRVKGRRLKGRVGRYDAAKTLRHTITLSIVSGRLPTASLAHRSDDVVALAAPWHFHALGRHTLTFGDDASAAVQWSTVEQVALIDARRLVELAWSDCHWPLDEDAVVPDRDFAFVARTAEIKADSTYGAEYGPVGAIRNGLALRALAHAGFPTLPLARYLSSGTTTPDGKADKAAFEASGDGIVIVGASPCVIRVEDVDPIARDPKAVALSLPWIATVGAGFDFGKEEKKLSGFRQAAKVQVDWDAPDTDWAAGSSLALSRQAGQSIGLRTAASGEIRKALKRAVFGRLSNGDAEVQALMPVEQAFPANLTTHAEATERPFWLRTLVALRTTWPCASKDPALMQARVTSLLPSGHADGKYARVAFSIADDAFAAKPREAGYDSPPAIFVAVGRSGVIVRELPTLEAEAMRAGDPDVASLRARLVARADTLVTDALRAIVVTTPAGPDTLGWIDIEIPPDLDNPQSSIRVTRPLAQRLYASPALGWPTRDGTVAAATGTLAMGSDLPFQDATPHPADDANSVREFGSGFSGRAASLALGARANGISTGARIATDSVAYLSLGRKMVFQRPESLPLMCPPARHLTPMPTRLVTPVAKQLEAALDNVVQGKAAAIVPPHVERTSFGLRPGAMQAEFDSLVFTQGKSNATREDLDQELAYFGRAGHAGPVLVRQVRPPRAPGLPRIPLVKIGKAPNFVESHGRRTYVCEDCTIVGTRMPEPFRLYDGIATVLRRIVEHTTRSYHVRVTNLPLCPATTWKGEISLWVASPLVKGVNLQTDLAQLGLLRADASVSASLSIGRLSFAFATATFAVPGDDVIITFERDPATTTVGPINEALARVDGDTPVVLTIRCAKENPQASTPTSPIALAQDSAPQPRLEEETRRSIVLPLTVRPSGRASLPVGISTLVFADPSYDRELSGPGAADVQRDGAGVAWKLAIDRTEYGSDTPIYLGFGMIDAATGKFAGGGDGSLTLGRSPAPERDGEAKDTEPLEIAGVTDPTIKAGHAYGVTFDRLRYRGGAPVRFEDGDQIVMSVAFPSDGSGAVKQRTLSVRAFVVPRPVIAPPPAVYSLVIPYGTGIDARASVALHATAPLPQKIEFADLVTDLALGHIRRRALFEWRVAKTPDVATARATLVKIDRAGGGQLPDLGVDIVDER